LPAVLLFGTMPPGLLLEPCVVCRLTSFFSIVKFCTPPPDKQTNKRDLAEKPRRKYSTPQCLFFILGLNLAVRRRALPQMRVCVQHPICSAIKRANDHFGHTPFLGSAGYDLTHSSGAPCLFFEGPARRVPKRLRKHPFRNFNVI